jgi:molybdopterin molybdotransferase
LGQTLAEDIVSSFDIPPHDNVAMDGYAVQALDINAATTANPSRLQIIGELPAGVTPQQAVEPGTAIRVMTGAPLPPGADTVVPFELTSEREYAQRVTVSSTISIYDPPPAGANIRRAGEDIRLGRVVLAKGIELRPAEIGVIASVGLARVKVHRRPRVAILSTGNELLEPGDLLVPGKIYDSNTYSLAALVRKYGGEPVVLGIALDEVEDIRARVRAGLETDLLLTSAGVSKGDYDVVKDVLAQRGRINFWSVRMKPAKPLAFGVLEAADGRQVPHLGLPGNPASALVAFEQFGSAAIYKMLGKGSFRRPTIEAVLDEPIYNPDGRRVYARAIVTSRDGAYHARLTGDQSSNLLTSMARANGLAICPEDLPMMPAGEVVKVEMLDWEEMS